MVGPCDGLGDDSGDGSRDGLGDGLKGVSIVGLNNNTAKPSFIGPADDLFYVTHMTGVILPGLGNFCPEPAAQGRIKKRQPAALVIAGFGEAGGANGAGMAVLVNDGGLGTEGADVGLHGQSFGVWRSQSQLMQ